LDLITGVNNSITEKGTERELFILFVSLAIPMDTFKVDEPAAEKSSVLKGEDKSIPENNEKLTVPAAARSNLAPVNVELDGPSEFAPNSWIEIVSFSRSIAASDSIVTTISNALESASQKVVPLLKTIFLTLMS